MTVEERIREERRAKLAQIAALGCELYPRRYAFSHTLAELARANPGENERPPVRVCGRITGLRAHGKAGFAHLTQDGARLQIYVRQDAILERDFALWKLLDLGDFIGVEGYLFRTRTGELTVHAQKLAFLAKDLRALPEKWHGLQDVELRYRRRYLDLIGNSGTRAAFARRAKMIEALRAAFGRRGYLEVETPMLQTLAGGAAARPFATHHRALDLPLYLRIAPELYLKRLVVGGLDRVYEINRNFRNEGISTRHNPEFTMLEFYEAYSDYRVLMDWSEQLLSEVAAATTGGREVGYGGERLDFGRCRRLELRDAVREFWPPAAGPAPAPAEVRDPRAAAKIAARYNAIARDSPDSRYRPVAVPPVAEEGVLIAALFEAIAEPELQQPTIVYDFPLAISPLAKAKADEPAWVERFEIFAGGMEIANGYSELNDPEEQRRRFAMQLERREAGDAEAHAMDEDYLRALEYGMPPTAGEGIGIDRLAMLLTDNTSIRDVVLFPLLRPRADDDADR